MDEGMSIFKWIFTLIINYFISLATLITAIAISLGKIQQPLMFATQDNLQDLYKVNLDDKDSKMYYFKEKTQKKKLFERGEQLTLLENQGIFSSEEIYKKIKGGQDLEKPDIFNKKIEKDIVKKEPNEEI
jgi:hypothetical protein